MTDYPRPAVRAIIVDEQQRILFLKRASTRYKEGAWCLPGGKVDFGQRVKDAVVVEVREETGLECESTEFLFYQDNLPTDELNTHFVTLYFKCKAQGSINLNEESSDFAWVGKGDAERYDIVFLNDQAVQGFWDSL